MIRESLKLSRRIEMITDMTGAYFKIIKLIRIYEISSNILEFYILKIIIFVMFLFCLFPITTISINYFLTVNCTFFQKCIGNLTKQSINVLEIFLIGTVKFSLNRGDFKK